MKINYLSFGLLLITGSGYALIDIIDGAADIATGTAEVAVSPVVELSPEHSTRYHARRGADRIEEGTGKIFTGNRAHRTHGNDLIAAEIARAE